MLMLELYNHYIIYYLLTIFIFIFENVGSWMKFVRFIAHDAVVANNGINSVVTFCLT